MNNRIKNFEGWSTSSEETPEYFGTKGALFLKSENIMCDKNVKLKDSQYRSCSCPSFKAVFPLAKVNAIMPAITPTTATLIVLALATLGNMTQIGLFIFMSLRPRWPRQVLFHVAVADNNDSVIA